MCVGTSVARAEDPVRLREEFSSGYEYHVSTRSDLSGSVTLREEKDKPAAKPLTISGDSAIEYDERILSVNKEGQVDKTARVYRKIDLQRKVGDQLQQSTLRPEVRKVVLVRSKSQKDPFSPDAPLTWQEIDLIRTDIFNPALVGMLPEKAVGIDDRWKVSAHALQEMSGLEKIDEGEVECRLEQFITLERRRHVRVGFGGTIRGVNDDGPTKQQITGYFYFDLESNHLSYLFVKGVHILLDQDGKEAGRMEGRFTLTRQVNQRCKDLSDESLRSWSLQPSAENTRLLFDNPSLGLRFVYPRRWHIASDQGRQVALAAADGSGLLLTIDAPESVPSGKQYLNESRDFLQKQKAKVLGFDEPRRIQDAPRELDQFNLDVEFGKERVLMAYYIARQGNGGVTVAARLPTNDSATFRKEVEGIARSIIVTKSISAEVEKKK
jgi:hypothetical protein